MSINISFGALPPRTKNISSKLIIGAKQKLLGLRQLQKEEGINFVVDLRSKNDIKKLMERFFCKILGLKYASFPMELANKKELSQKAFLDIFQMIDANKTGKTFVHCNSGRHRSLFVASMLKFKEGFFKTKEDFIEYLKQNEFYKLKKKVRFGIKVSLSPKDVIERTDNLNYQKDKFWDFLNSCK